MTLIEISGIGLLLAFILYCVSFLLFVISLTGKKFSNRVPEEHQKKWGKIAFVIAVIGLVCQLIYFITRWIDSGYIPTSNMFEFMTMLGMMIAIAFVVIYLIYRTALLGVFAMPVSAVIIAYASVFPREVQPLIPALKSYWLYIHVTLAALGEAFFAVGFAAGLMYLILTVKYNDPNKRWERRGVEFSLFVILMVIGFVIFNYGFKGADYSAQFIERVEIEDTKTGEMIEYENKVDYVLPPIVKPYASEQVHMDSFLGMKSAPLEAPSWMEGVNAARKLNTVIWSLFGGIILYGLFRLIIRKPMGLVISKIMDGIKPDDLDEISYRAIAIGYPIFALGGLVFAMIWAAEAWGRFWAWDPKETWALITFLFYTVYLHLRLAVGWHGKKSSWLAVIGFLIVMFTLIGVNLIIAGLHSYAGV